MSLIRYVAFHRVSIHLAKERHMKKKPDFELLSRDERAPVVRALMEQGHSNNTAARAVRTTRGTIVALRRDYGIPSTHPGRNRPPRRSEPKRPKKPKGPKGQVAASEAKQCVMMVDRHRCAYEKTDGDYCWLHR